MSQSGYISRGGKVFVTPNGDGSTQVTGRVFETQIASGSGLPSGTWASFETPDVFAATGSPNLAGILNATETKDAFSGAGLVPYTAVLDATDAKDTMTAAGLGPVAGSLSATEKPDTWATSNGFEAPGIESHKMVPSAFTVSTEGPDRILVLTFATIGVGQFLDVITSIDDSAGLEWHQHIYTAEQLYGTGELSSQGLTLMVWWAHAHNKLTDDSVSVNFSGNATLLMSQITVVKGTNGNYDYPWHPTAPGFAPISNYAHTNESQTAEDAVISPWGTGTSARTSVPYPTILMSFAMSNDHTPFSPPFTLLDDQSFSGTQNNGTLNVGAQYSNVSIPWEINDSTNNALAWGGLHSVYLAVADALIVNTPPDRFIGQEAADSFHATGYTGDSIRFGQLHATETPDTFAGTGYMAASGILFATEAKDTFSAFIKVPLTATLNATEAKDRMTAAGIGLGEDGEWHSTESVDTFAGTGYSPVSGTFNTTETTDRARFIGVGVVSQRKRRTFYVT